MSLLAPLYMLGLAAISLPLVLHLVRRMPRGRQPFSSLMFLAASPPRLTRKSRLDDLLLLLLRGLALGLLTLAFARPFVRAITPMDVTEPLGRKIAIVVDTSASMQRPGLWEKAVAEATKMIDDLGPGDDAALVAFDADVQTPVGFGGPQTADPDRKTARLRDALGQLAPGWKASDLGLALAAAADAVDDAAARGRSGGDAQRLVVLIGDLQEGSSLDALARYQWPDEVRLAVRPVAALRATNAGLQLAGGRPAEDGRLRVRVTNDRDSLGRQFRLSWLDRQGKAAEPPIDVVVPPGESSVVAVSRPDAALGGLRLVLSGDDQPFDNSLYVVPLEQQEVTVGYVGGDKADDVDGLLYYLKRALPETPGRKVRVEPWGLSQFSRSRAPTEGWSGTVPLSPSGSKNQNVPFLSLVVVGEAISDEQAEPLADYARGGGTLLYVLRDAAAGAGLASVLGIGRLAIEEADGADYAMLGRIDFEHPLFAPFADPRFSDFTKIHFWRHRRVELADLPGVDVPAIFDDGSPALFERAVGAGRVIVLTSGWHPADSELARSSKFVPLVSEILDRAGGREATPQQHTVGDRVPLPPVPLAEAGGNRSPDPELPRQTPDPPLVVETPDGRRISLPPAAATFDQADEPGVYRVLRGEGPGTRFPALAFAVNLAAAESKTAPLDLGELEQRGVRLGPAESRAELAEQARQMQEAELEDRQKLWQWLLAVALGVLIVETALGGHLARRPAKSSSAGPPESGAADREDA